MNSAISRQQTPSKLIPRIPVHGSPIAGPPQHSQNVPGPSQRGSPITVRQPIAHAAEGDWSLVSLAHEQRPQPQEWPVMNPQVEQHGAALLCSCA